MRPRRSALFVPGSKPRALAKAAGLAADVLILDLEDSVAPEMKAEARQQVCQIVASRPFGQREVVVRINGLATRWGGADLAEVAAAGPDAILLPKVDRPDQLRRARERLPRAAGGLPLWAMVETPRGILAVDAVAAAGVSVLVVGTNDLSAELRLRASPDRAALVPALARTVWAARAHGCGALDGVFNPLDAPEQLARECRQGAALGFDGKTLIHPSQVASCNAAYAPDPADVAWARAVIDAFEDPANARLGAISVAGRMVERLHLEPARRTIARVEAIGAVSSPGCRPA